MKISIETVDSDQERWMLDVIRGAIHASLKMEVQKLCTKVVKAKEEELIAMATKTLKTIPVTPPTKKVTKRAQV